MVGNEEMDKLEKDGKLGKKYGGRIDNFCCDGMLGSERLRVSYSSATDETQRVRRTRANGTKSVKGTSH